MMKPLTGRGVLLWLLCTFGVVFAVNGFFIARAVSTYPGEDVHNPYLQGVDYNRRLQAHAEQAAEGWRATIGAKRIGANRIDIEVRVDNTEGSLPHNFSLSGLLRHPMDEERDRALKFTANGPHRFISRITGVSAGGWDIQVKANGSVPFEASRRIWLP
jgi:nitrogen fixation protein FixH